MLQFSLRRYLLCVLIFFACALFLAVGISSNAFAQTENQGTKNNGRQAQAARAVPDLTAYRTGEVFSVPRINFGVSPSNSPEDVSVSLQIIILLTVLSLAPSILVMATAFTRIVIVLSFVRRALATQQLPSNQIIVGISLILTFFVMAPTFAEINTKSVQPYFQRQITQIEAVSRASESLRDFMLKQTQESDLSLFISLVRNQKYEKKSEVPFYVVMPAFVLSEMKIAFEMGIVIFLPFLVIDMVVASILMSMGMMMLPPVMISLPFKILVFVLADGWHLIIKSLVSSFA